MAMIVYCLISISVLCVFSLLTWKNVQANLTRQRTLQQSVTRMLFAQIVVNT
jgi:hypothetical protein